MAAAAQRFVASASAAFVAAFLASATRAQELAPFGDEPVAQPRIPVGPIFGNGDPSPNALSAGNRIVGLPIVGQRRDEIMLARLVGGAFEPMKTLMHVRGGAAVRRGPRIAAWGSTVVVTAPEQGGAEQRRILAVRSTDGGATWSEPISITDRSGVAGEGFHELVTTTAGHFVVAWLDSRDGHGQALYASRSTDGGAAWSPNARIYASPDGSVCECCPISMAAGPDERVSIVFRNSLAGARDLHETLSPDGGKTWEPPTRLRGVPWNLAACPMAEGAVTFNDAFGREARQSTFITSRDGVLSLWRRKEWEGARPIGRGRRPTMLRNEVMLLFAYAEETGGGIVAGVSFGDGPLRRLSFPRPAEGERFDSPAFGGQMLGTTSLVYEVHRDGKVRSRLHQFTTLEYPKDPRLPGDTSDLGESRPAR